MGYYYIIRYLMETAIIMILDQEIAIQPPPYTDHNNNLIQPNIIRFKILDVTYIDNPLAKLVYAQIREVPGMIILLDKNEYDIFGDYTQNQIENRLKEKLGPDIGAKLRSMFPKTLEENPYGPGTILSQMISSIGIKSSPTCSCRRHALEMNEKGVEWCEQNIPTIIEWLKEESTKRNIPFIESLAILIVKRAIKKSKKYLSNKY